MRVPRVEGNVKVTRGKKDLEKKKLNLPIIIGSRGHSQAQIVPACGCLGGMGHYGALLVADLAKNNKVVGPAGDICAWELC